MAAAAISCMCSAFLRMAARMRAAPLGWSKKIHSSNGREDFRQALNAAMPKFLVEGQQDAGAKSAQVVSPKDEIRRIIEQVTPRTWKQDKARILQLLEML